MLLKFKVDEEGSDDESFEEDFEELNEDFDGRELRHLLLGVIISVLRFDLHMGLCVFRD